MPETQKRILIIRLSAVGDVLRVLPAYQVIKKQFPGSFVAWVVEEKAADIIKAHKGVDQVFIFPKERLLRQLRSPRRIFNGLKEFRTFMSEIRKDRFDLVFDFHGLFKSGVISLFSGAPDRYGFSRPCTKELNFLFNNHRFALNPRHVSRIERNLALLRGMGLDTAHDPPQIYIPEGDREKIQSFFKQSRIDFNRPVIAVHPGTSPTTPYKRWDSYRYAVTADQAIEDNAAQIVFTWAGKEREMVEEIMSQMKHRALIAPETQNLCQLAHIFRLCDLYLGSDTGPMHLAAFTGTPVVALFGPTDHVVNEPYTSTPHIIIRNDIECSPCRKYNCSRRHCMKGIKEESVMRAIDIMLRSFPRTQNKAEGA